MPIERHVKAYLILNWKDNSVRVVKRLPKKSNLGLNDIPIKLDLTLVVPEPEEITIKGEVKLSEAQISNITIATFTGE